MFGHLGATRRDETSTFGTRRFFIAGPQGSDGVTRNFSHLGCGSAENGRPAARAAPPQPVHSLRPWRVGPAIAGLALLGPAVRAPAQGSAAAAGEGRHRPAP